MTHEIAPTDWRGKPSFGGGALTGSRHVRVAYFDEAGLSAKADEPYLVVAGVITNPDVHYQPLEAHIRSLAEDALGDKATPYYGRPYIFHAKDVWHGSGDFDRDEWSLKARMKLLELLCRIPGQFGLPVVFGRVAKNGSSPPLPRLPQDNQLPWLHSTAYFLAARRVEAWMANNASDEVISIISERCDPKHIANISSLHHLITDRSIPDKDKERLGAFVSERIVEAPIFLDKFSSPLLQVADVCAFVLKRKSQKCRHIGPYFDLIREAIWFEPKDGDGVMGRAPLSDVRILKSGDPG